jgi:hypothetical protein
MAYWTVLCKADTGGSFAVTLDTDEHKWVASGPAVNTVFSTKSGRYIVKPAPELGTWLLPAAGNTAVAVLTNLTGSTGIGATGRGKQFETATNFDWKLDSM